MHKDRKDLLGGVPSDFIMSRSGCQFGVFLLISPLFLLFSLSIKGSRAHGQDPGHGALIQLSGHRVR